MVCKGICIRHKAIKPALAGRYSSGQKRCQICEMFINWDASNLCPCCGYKLRGRPRSLKYKAKLRQQMVATAAMATATTTAPTRISKAK